MLAACAIALLSPGSARAGDSGVSAVDFLERPIRARINAVRRAHGLRPLAGSWRLRRAADAHSAAMARSGFFSHMSADGTAFWRRIERYYPSAGYRAWRVGENLLWMSPGVRPRQAVRMWMRSRSHRAVLLSSRWRRIGISAVHVTSAPGVYHGYDVTIVTADFGLRS